MARKTMGGPVPPGATVYHTKPKDAPKKFSELAVGGGGRSILDAVSCSLSIAT